MAESCALLCGFGAINEADSRGPCAAPQPETRGRVKAYFRWCGEDLVALDDALKLLAELDPRKAEVVEMRFFGGLSVEETAEVLKVSAVTVMRDWSTARAWLYRELAGDISNES